MELIDKSKQFVSEANQELKRVTWPAKKHVAASTWVVIGLVKGEKKTISRKFFPGYILVSMELNEETWHLVKSTPKVTGFVGGTTVPQAISEDEVRKITHQMEEGAVKPKPKVLFDRGENVRVVDGPFTNFTGIVDEVKPEKGKLKVLVSIFGRATPVELDFVQVEKA